MRKKLLTFVAGLALWGTISPAHAVNYHAYWVGMLSPDWFGAAFRALNTAVKYFLSDDTGMVASLAWDGLAESSSASGCGGCYGGKTDAALNPATVELESIVIRPSIDESAYGTTGYVAQNKVVDLAKKRIQTIVEERASVDQLTADAQKVYYNSQQRSIQAMTDALVMKNAYESLRDIVATLPTDFSDYSKTASAIASRRLILDELLALKKRVIAARIRTKGLTREIEAIDKGVLTPPTL